MKCDSNPIPGLSLLHWIFHIPAFAETLWKMYSPWTHNRMAHPYTYMYSYWQTTCKLSHLNTRSFQIMLAPKRIPSFAPLCWRAGASQPSSFSANMPSVFQCHTCYQCVLAQTLLYRDIPMPSCKCHYVHTS